MHPTRLFWYLTVAAVLLFFSGLTAPSKARYFASLRPALLVFLIGGMITISNANRLYPLGSASWLEFLTVGLVSFALPWWGVSAGYHLRLKLGLPVLILPNRRDRARARAASAQPQ